MAEYDDMDVLRALVDLADEGRLDIGVDRTTGEPSFADPLAALLVDTEHNDSKASS